MTEDVVRRGLLLRTTLEILRDAGVGVRVPQPQVLDQLRQRVDLNAAELSVNDSGGTRWDYAIGWSTGDAATIGWMTKIDGWAITEAGIDALETYPDSDALWQALRHRRAEIRRERMRAKEELSGSEERIAGLVAALPAGSWTSYADLAEIAGASENTIATFLAAKYVSGAYRVLTNDGDVPPEGMTYVNYRGIDLQAKLAAEGVEFDHSGLAGRRQRVTAEELRERIAELPEESAEPLTPSAWMVRGTSVEGYNLVDQWLDGGWVSLAASRLAPLVLDQALGPADLRHAVSKAYDNRSVSYQQQRLTEFERFLHRMRDGDLVLTTSHGEVFLGEIAGPPRFTESDGGRSNLRRAVRWLNRGRPVQRDDLHPPLPALLADQAYVVDLTEALDELARLADPFRRAEPGATAPAIPPVPEAPPAVRPALPAATPQLAAGLLVPQQWLQFVTDRLQARSQVILYGPPGTGKTYLARELARHLAGGLDHAVKLVQFHPSYSYEDFFEGFRPRSVDGALSFVLTSGPLRTFAEDAADNPATPYVLIIDEINRANLAKVFGELYFLLEYRGAAISLQYSPEKTFQLPQNLFIIGTMNTADRSIALVDAAMRRRFAFIELHPRSDPVRGLLREWLVSNEIASSAADLLDTLNGEIGDPEFAIGPSYFMREDIYERDDGLDLVWQTEIMPLLEEQYYDLGRDAVADRFGLPAIRKIVRARSPDPDPVPAVDPAPADAVGETAGYGGDEENQAP